MLRPHVSRAPQVCSKGADYEGYSAAITRCSFGGDVIDALDINDVTQLMESMGMSTHHRLVLKATFTGWKKSPGAAFEALASAKVAHAEHVAPLPCDVRLQAAAAEKAQVQAAAAKKKQEEAAAAKKAQEEAAAAKKKQDEAAAAQSLAQRKVRFVPPDPPRRRLSAACCSRTLAGRCCSQHQGQTGHH